MPQRHRQRGNGVLATMKWLQTRDWNVLSAKIIVACGFFVSGGVLSGFVPAKHAAVVGAVATAVIALLRPVSDPAEKS